MPTSARANNSGKSTSFAAAPGSRGVKKTCRCRHVKKICRWHIFSVDLSGYAAVASILVCTAPSFSPDLSGYAAVAPARSISTSDQKRRIDFLHRPASRLRRAGLARPAPDILLFSFFLPGVTGYARVSGGAAKLYGCPVAVPKISALPYGGRLKF